MEKIRPAIKLDRLQKVKTEDDKSLRFGNVVLIRWHLFSRKLIPMDLITGKTITEMALWENEKWMVVDTDSFKATGLFSSQFTCWFTGEEAP